MMGNSFLEPFLRFSLPLKSWITLRRTGLSFCKMPLILGPSAISLWPDSGPVFLAGTPQKWCKLFPRPEIRVTWGQPIVSRVILTFITGSSWCLTDFSTLKLPFQLCRGTFRDYADILFSIEPLHTKWCIPSINHFCLNQPPQWW